MPRREKNSATRLLDTAERLFGEYGYDGVGVRMITEEAGVNLGAVTYHFGSKEALYVETFMRHARPMHAESMRRLNVAKEAYGGNPLPIERVIECMLDPMFDTSLGVNESSDRFIARTILTPPPFMAKVLRENISPVIETFLVEMQHSLPEIPEDLLHFRHMFAMGSIMMFTIKSMNMPGMKDEKLREAMIREMIRFIAAGMSEKPATDPADRPKLPSNPAEMGG